MTVVAPSEKVAPGKCEAVIVVEQPSVTVGGVHKAMALLHELPIAGSEILAGQPVKTGALVS